MKSWWLPIAFSVLSCSAPQPAAPPRPVTLGSLLEEMTDRAALARLADPTFTVRQASSFDRRTQDPADPDGWFANEDWSHFVRSEVHAGRTEWVMLDAEGPGAVVRFWVTGPRPEGRLRFYLDGAEEPVIDEVLFALFTGASFVPAPLALENAPLRGDVVGGLNLYLPVPYAQRCVITYEDGREGPPPSRYFNIEYRTYAPGTAVESFTRAGYEVARPAVQRACALLQAPFAELGGAGGSALLEIGSSLSLSRHFESSDGGAVDLVEVRVDVPQADRPRVLRSLILTGSFDGEPTIWCPVGEFFGSGVGLNPVRNLYCETSPEQGLLRAAWLMPFERSAELTLVNLGPTPVQAALDVRVRDWRWDERSTHFWTTWRRERAIPTRPFQDWNYVSVEGQGRYLGDTLSVFNPVRAWWGEGDEKVWVDGGSFPSHVGTGTEDHYGYSYCNPVVFQSPFCNQPRVDGPANAGHVTNHRSRDLDAIPFTQGLRYEIEVWSWAETEMTYAVASRFYARPGARVHRDPQPAEATAALEELPKPRQIPGAIECEGLEILARSERLAAEPQSGALSEGTWSGDAQLWLRGQGVGDFVELAIPAPGPERRRLVLYATRSWDYAVLRLTVNGAPAGPDLDFFSPQVLLAEPLTLGEFEPVDGRFVLRAEVVGAHPDARPPQAYFGFDCIVAELP